MLSTPQTWVLLGLVGVLVTGMLSLLALSSAGLRGLIDARFDAVDTRFDAVDRRLDGLDRDVQVLTERPFRERP